MDDHALIDRATQALEQLGLTVRARPLHDRARPGPDARLRVGTGKQFIDYVAEVKRTVTPATLGAVLAQLRQYAAEHGKPALLITDYLTPPMAERLRALEQQFADAAGNAYLQGPGLLVYVTGRKPREPRTAQGGGQAFTNAGLKIQFALICRPTLAAEPHRTIAAAAGVALGAVPAVLADLAGAGHLMTLGKQRRLNATKRLLDEWALAYARKLRHKTLFAVYTTPNFDTWREWPIDPKIARWGGEPAANLLTDYLRPGVLTLYAQEALPRLIIDQRMTRETRTPETRYLELRRPFWGTTLQADARPDTVPAALVYADLLATDDGRCIETAGMIHDGYLARLFPAR